MVNLFQNGKKLNTEDTETAQRARSFPRGRISGGADCFQWLHVALDLGGKLVLGNFMLRARGERQVRRARVSRAPTTSCPTELCGGALGVQGHYLLGYLFYVGDAE